MGTSDWRPSARMAGWTRADRLQVRVSVVVGAAASLVMLVRRRSLSPGVAFVLRVVAATATANSERVREVNRRAEPPDG